MRLSPPGGRARSPRFGGGRPRTPRRAPSGGFDQVHGAAGRGVVPELLPRGAFVPGPSAPGGSRFRRGCAGGADRRFVRCSRRSRRNGRTDASSSAHRVNGRCGCTGRARGGRCGPGNHSSRRRQFFFSITTCPWSAVSIRQTRSRAPLRSRASAILPSPRSTFLRSAFASAENGPARCATESYPVRWKNAKRGKTPSRFAQSTRSSNSPRNASSTFAQFPAR